MKTVHTEIPGKLTGDACHLLAEHRSLYGAGFTWKPAVGETCSFKSEFYATQEESDIATAQALLDLGYTFPRWWEYWRWGEVRPSPRTQFYMGYLPEPS